MASLPGLSAEELISIKRKNITISSSMSTKGMIQATLASVTEPNLSSRFEQAINRASQNIAIDLKAALDAALLSNVWQTPSGSADIYDTGNLLESGSVVSTGRGLTIAYTAPYASLVHFGGYIHPYGNLNARVYLPPRPWIQSVLSGNGPIPQFDLARYYMDEILAEFR